MLRATRTAVNLSLIVAMTLQPATLQAWGRSCGARLDSSANGSQSCGCCANAVTDQACCCCTQEPAEQADELENASGTCCGAQGDLPSHTTFTDMSGSAERNAESAGLPDEPSREREDGQQVFPEGDIATIHALSDACRCVTSPDPGNLPWNPRLRLQEIRDLLSCNLLSGTVAEIVDTPPMAANTVSERPCLATHFSQVSFCVWRL